MSRSRYEVVFRPSPGRPITPLHATADPNEATMLFHTELSRLRAAGASGDVLMRTKDEDPQVLLREPVAWPHAEDEVAPSASRAPGRRRRRRRKRGTPAA